MRNIFRFIIISVVFLFSILMTGAQSGRPITYDETVSGSLDSEVYEQFYTFDGQAGDTILIQMRATSEEPRLDSYLYLRDAEGNELAFDDDAGGNLNSLIGPYTLDSTGTYTVVATRFQQAQGNSSGEYELSVTRAESRAISPGESVQFELDNDSNVEFFTLTAETSGLYEVRYHLVSGTASTDIAFRRPQGEYITGVMVDMNNPSNFTVMKLDAGQQVNIVARYYTGYDYQGQPLEDGEPVAVQFSVERVQTEAIPVEPGQTLDLSGILATRADVSYYSFNAVAGQTLSMTGETSGAGDVEVYVIMPDSMTGFYGSTFYNEGNTLVPPQIVLQTGEHTLVVHRNIMGPDSIDDAIPVMYDLAVNLAETPQLEPGIPVEGSIDTAANQYESAYLYEGLAGETITINLTNVNDTYEPSFSMEITQQGMMMESPGGSFYANFGSSNPGSISYEVTLPRDATYILRIHDGFYQPDENETGVYRLVIESDR